MKGQKSRRGGFHRKRKQSSESPYCWAGGQEGRVGGRGSSRETDLRYCCCCYYYHHNYPPHHHRYCFVQIETRRAFQERKGPRGSAQKHRESRVQGTHTRGTTACNPAASLPGRGSQSKLVISLVNNTKHLLSSKPAHREAHVLSSTSEPAVGT